jgi:hypothetical protein
MGIFLGKLPVLILGSVAFLTLFIYPFRHRIARRWLIIEDFYELLFVDVFKHWEIKEVSLLNGRYLKKHMRKDL